MYVSHGTTAPVLGLVPVSLLLQVTVMPLPLPLLWRFSYSDAWPRTSAATAHSPSTLLRPSTQPMHMTNFPNSTAGSQLHGAHEGATSQARGNGVLPHSPHKRKVTCVVVGDPRKGWANLTFKQLSCSWPMDRTKSEKGPSSHHRS